VRLSRECKRQFKAGPSACFEFAVSDVVEIIPVVKHMHQVCMDEPAQMTYHDHIHIHIHVVGVFVVVDRSIWEKVSCSLCAGKTKKTKVPVQVVLFFPQQVSLRSLVYVDYVGAGVIVRLMHLAVHKLHAALKAVPDDERTINGLADAYQTLAFAEWRAQGGGGGRYNMEQSEGFRLYRSLLSDDVHSRCSHTGLSHKGTRHQWCLYLPLQSHLIVGCG
jgi:hypothetical protein